MLTGGLAIDASGNDNDPNVDNGGGSRALNISVSGYDGISGNVTLKNLTITGGDSIGNGGGIQCRASGPTLTIIDSHILKNHGNGSGGGIFLDAVRAELHEFCGVRRARVVSDAAKLDSSAREWRAHVASVATNWNMR